MQAATAAARVRRDLPAVWLFTDQRIGGRAETLAAARALPRGSGVVLRHYNLATPDRAALLAALRPVARRRGLVLLVAAPWPGARADGVHLSGFAALPRHRRQGIVSAATHSASELRRAARAGADLLFLSPVFATASHPGARTLGPLRFGLAARGTRVPVVPLGGMEARRAARLRPLGGYGFAAISAFRAAMPSTTLWTWAESSKAKPTSPARAITTRADGTT
ncbi:MAG: thiamine phosphate synthase [Thermaurantiacus sp.]